MQRWQGRRADRGNHWQHGPPPRMKHAARRRGFDDLLGHQREEEHHRDVVDRKRDRKGETVVALGRGVDPHQGDQRAERQQEQVLDGEPRQTRNSRSPPGLRRRPFAVGWSSFMRLAPASASASAASGLSVDTPESTILPVREIDLKVQLGACNLDEHEALVLIEIRGRLVRRAHVALSQLTRRA